VTASSTAVNGTQTLEVKSVAQSGYMTGAKINTVKDGSKDETETKLSELGYKGEATSFDVKLGDGTKTTVKIDRSTTISDIVTALGNAGLNANFDTNQGRFYVSSKTTGEASDFTFVPSTITKDSDGNTTKDSTDALDALYALGLATSSQRSGNAAGDVTVTRTGQDTANNTVTSKLTISFKDYAPTSKAAADEQNALVDAIKNAEYDSTTNQPILSGYIMKDGVIYEADKDGKIVYENVTDENGNPVYETDENGKPVYETDENGNKIAKVKVKAKALASYSQTESVKDENGSEATLSGDVTWGTATVKTGDAATYSMAEKIKGEDSTIILNNVEYTSTTNSYSINGLSINALAKTDSPITITTATDTQAIYDKIKDFLTEYNSIINEMTKLYNADSSYGYDPLTDDEKDAMSDTEIEKWETKIKDSLLRNDSTLNGVMMAMINSMSSSYTINGQKYTLSSFGIATLGYLNAAENENYAYHIDGDSDDDNTSSNDDKLMAAITEDPDTVIEFMKQLTSGLYTAIGNKMKSTTLSSAYTIYNDKEMNSQYSEYSTTISKWEDKLSDKEDYYYNKFAQMESALTKLQSQSSSVTGLFSS
jgi:flagellar hook-associated protein 2